MPKLWIGNKMYSVEGEVRDYCEKLGERIEELEANLERINDIAKWICYACGEAENVEDVSCVVEVWAGEPECCPLTGEDCEWCEVKDK